MPAQSYLTSRCDEDNFQDTRLSSWRTEIQLKDLNNQEFHTQVLQSYPYAYVYCFRLRITIEGETLRCPPFVFKYNASVSWNSSDKYNYQGITFREYQSSTFFEIHPDIHHVHFRNESHILDDNLALDKIENLKKLIAEMELRNVALNLPIAGGSLSYSTTTTILLCLSIGLFVLMAYVMYQTTFTSKKRHHKVMRTVTDSIYGDGTYAMVRSRTSVSKDRAPPLPSRPPPTVAPQVNVNVNSSVPQAAHQSIVETTTNIAPDAEHRRN